MKTEASNLIFELKPCELPCGCMSRPHRAGFVQAPRQHRGDAAAWHPPLSRRHPRKQKGSGSKTTEQRYKNDQTATCDPYV